VDPKTPSDDSPLTTVETVRCLSCGSAYAKPLGGGTVQANPGCPDCGYVGWVLAESQVLTGGLAHRRFSADPPRRRSA
jgi:hypothetical protein